MFPMYNYYDVMIIDIMMLTEYQVHKLYIYNIIYTQYIRFRKNTKTHFNKLNIKKKINLF